MRYYINKMLHFETIIIYRNENNYVVLKCQFENIINDLKTMISDTIFILINKYQNYLIKINNVKSNFLCNFAN